MRKLRLLQTHSIVFTRTGSTTDKPYVNEYGETVTPSTTSQISTIGSLQPRSRMNNRSAKPDGMMEQDYYSYYTDSDLRTVEQVGNNLADRCTINDKEFKVTREGNWDGFGLTVDHKEYFLQMIQPLGS